MKAKRVGLWAAGIFVAGHVSGCAFAWMAAARADDVATVVCTETRRAEYEVGSEDPAELARVTAVRVFATPRPDTPPRTATIGGVAFAGSLAIVTCDPGDRVTFAAR